MSATVSNVILCNLLPTYRLTLLISVPNQRPRGADYIHIPDSWWLEETAGICVRKTYQTDHSESDQELWCNRTGYKRKMNRKHFWEIFLGQKWNILGPNLPKQKWQRKDQTKLDLIKLKKATVDSVYLNRFRKYVVCMEKHLSQADFIILGSKCC